MGVHRFREYAPIKHKRKGKKQRIINVSMLRGDARLLMWTKIEEELPALAEFLQSEGCIKARQALGLSVIVRIDGSGHLFSIS